MPQEIRASTLTTTGAMIYLDNHSATLPCSTALERMTPYLQNHWGAHFAPHKMGQELMAAIDTREQTMLDLVGANPPDRFIFTSSGAEAINQVFWSVFLEVARKEGKTHFIISEMEDAPTMQCAKRLEELGCTIKIVPVKDGLIDLDALAQMISLRTALISLTMANGLTGVIQPFDQIIELAKEKKVLLHLDANYAVGKFPITFASDYLTFSGDLIHSVKGSGGLFVKEQAPVVPLILGGAHIRGGSFDVPSFMALCAASQQSILYLDTMALEVVRLRDLFESLIDGKAQYSEMLRLPNCSLISFEKVHQDALLYFLNRKGIFANIGGRLAAHLTDKTAISFALSRMTTEEEIIKAASIINDTVFELKKISEAL